MQVFELPDQFFFTVEQVATYLQVSDQTVRRHTKRKPNDPFYLPSYFVSENIVRITAVDLRQWIDRRLKH